MSSLQKAFMSQSSVHQIKLYPHESDKSDMINITNISTTGRATRSGNGLAKGQLDLQRLYKRS